MTSKIEEYAKSRWYITINGDSVKVKKGSTKRMFKMSRYDTEDALIADIEAYMNSDISLFNKKYK